jgi:hypothetical protein
MVASRNRPKGSLEAPFGLGILILVLLTGEVGRQDLAAAIAREPIVDRAQKAAFASPFGTVHEAKFNAPQPLAAASIPLPLDYQLIGFDPNSAGGAGSIRERFPGEETFFTSPYAGPMVDRSRKGDYGVARDRLMALKGDRLKPGRPADVADDTPAGVANAARNAERQATLAESTVHTGRYSLASAADADAAMPKGSAAKSGYPMLAPPQRDARADTNDRTAAAADPPARPARRKCFRARRRGKERAALPRA